MIQEPTVTHLGTTEGEWPIIVFSTAAKAARWASENRHRLVWPVKQITLENPMRGREVPASYELRHHSYELADDEDETRP